MGKIEQIICLVALFEENNSTFLNKIAALGAAASQDDKQRKSNSRYWRDGTLGNPRNSIWRRTDLLGDDLEFLHFTGFSRESFNQLAALTREGFLKYPIRKRYNSPQKHHVKRRHHTSRDILSMTIKYLTSNCELKNLSVQFGAHESTFIDCVHWWMWVLIEA